MYLLLNRYMNMYNLIIRPLLFCIDPEKVHRMLLSWLKFYRYLFPVRACVRGYSRVSDPFSYGHLQFKNRIGLSAGFDKNAEAFDELADFGFGFLEVGTPIFPRLLPGLGTFVRMSPDKKETYIHF